MSGKTARGFMWGFGVAGVILVFAAWTEFRRPPAIPTIALIPQTAGSMLWDVEHLGASVAADKAKIHLYWNAPTSETDTAGQVSLIDRLSRGKYQGLVVAPNHPLLTLAPLRHTLEAGMPVMVVSTMLDLPAGSKLGYIVNDDVKMGELAASEAARLIHGKGAVALLGYTRDAPGVISRIQSAERFLAEKFPDIHIVGRLMGAYNTARAEEVTSSTAEAHPELKAVVSFTASSTRGAYAALKSRALLPQVVLVGCEQDVDLIGYLWAGDIAGIVAENTYRMGHDAVEALAGSFEGRALPARLVVPPLLLTKQNLNSAEAAVFTSLTR